MGRDEVEKLADPAPSGFVCSFLSFSHEMLEFGEELFDRIEIGAIGWQEEEVCLFLSDRLSGCLALVRAQIVQDDDISLLEGRSENLFDICGEHFPVDRTIDDEGRVDSVMAERRDEGERFPVAIGDLGCQTLALGTPAAQRSHIGLDPGFVEENEPARRDTLLINLPPNTLSGDVRSILLGRQNRFF